MQITVIRHLPTEWNIKTWLQGRQDIELSQVSDELSKGIETNRKVIERLAPFDLVLASTLQRTQQTANLYGYTYEIEGLLDELDFGPFEGVPKKKLIAKYGEVWFENPRELVLGESIKNLEKRIVKFLDKYQTYTNILAFGHGSWIRALISYVQYGDINLMNKIEVVNNACITLSIEPKA